MSAAKPLVMLSADELAQLVRDAVRAELGAAVIAAREILTRDEAAELLQVHPQVVLRLVRSDGLPASKVGPQYRFKRADVLKWFEEHAVRPGAHTERAGRKLRALKGGT